LQCHLLSPYCCRFVNFYVKGAVWGGGSRYVRSLLKDTAETESEAAEKSSWDPPVEEKNLFFFGEIERKLPLLTVLSFNYFMKDCNEEKKQKIQT
jgi:hypothetical protein